MQGTSNLRETGCDVREWTHLAQDWNQGEVPDNMEINLRVLGKGTLLN